MSRTYPEALPQLKTAIRVALLKRAPDYGRSVWEEDLAEEIQVHVNTIRNAIRAKGLLNAAALWCLCEKFSGFEREIYGKDSMPDCGPDLSLHAKRLRALADDIEAGDTRVVPLKGSIS